jgi:hypothetical protein
MLQTYIQNPVAAWGEKQINSIHNRAQSNFKRFQAPKKRLKDAINPDFTSKTG